jgi:hypothetical protein
MLRADIPANIGWSWSKASYAAAFIAAGHALLLKLSTG